MQPRKADSIALLDAADGTADRGHRSHAFVAGIEGRLWLAGPSAVAAGGCVGQIPVAAMRTRIWFSFGCGTATSSSASDLPSSRTTAAFIVLPIAVSSRIAAVEAR